MALFKILHGDSSRINVDATPFHEGWCYITHDGSFYADLNVGTKESPNNKRIQINDAIIKRLEALEQFIYNLPPMNQIDGAEVRDAGLITEVNVSEYSIFDLGVIV
jgi:hypothetical protein